ncbi:MAG TPA: nuclear transport factor 2 family protein [Longimicrobiales bacterium]|nr:nuclear transport factor 2 family protein [Longimicrobiales bacterium]
MIAVLLIAATMQTQLTIRGADSLWAKNYAINDTVTAGKLMADNFVMGSSNGRYKTKAQEMGDIRPTPGLVGAYFRTRDVTVYDYTTTAVVRGIAEWAFTFNGRFSEAVRNYTAVYNRGGPLGWQLVALFMGVPPQTPKLSDLKWIEGTWRGSGGNVPAFYERYRLQDDTTLVVESFADSTLSKVTETSYFESRQGRVTNRGNAQWYASAVSRDSIAFAPLRGVTNTFVWKRGRNADEWEAVLAWPANASRPARSVTYIMKRVQ